jgi:folate-binding protein YgfZ
VLQQRWRLDHSPEEVRAAHEGVAGRTALVDQCLSGGDPCGALDRIVSQDVKRLPAGEGRLALLLAPKGQFRALMAVCAAADGLLLVAPPGRGEALASGLANYLRFSRCTFAPVTAGGAGLLVVGPNWAAGATAAGADAAVLAEGGASRVGNGAAGTIWLGQTFLGVAGAIAVTDRAAIDGLEVAVVAAGAVPVSAGVLDLIRIRAAFPAWGAELTDTVLPPEVGIDGSAISDTKGCYVGQETIARMRTYGRPNRRLVPVRQVETAGGTPQLPLALVAPGEDKPRATLTSFGVDPELGGIGLALVRREIAAAGTRLSAGTLDFEIVEKFTVHS